MALFFMPTYVYYADGRTVLVAAQTPHEALAPGWAEHPAGPFPTNGAGPPPVETVVVVSFPPAAQEESSLAALSEAAPDGEPPEATVRRKGWPKGKPRGPRVKE